MLVFIYIVLYLISLKSIFIMHRNNNLIPSNIFFKLYGKGLVIIKAIIISEASIISLCYLFPVFWRIVMPI